MVASGRIELPRPCGHWIFLPLSFSRANKQSLFVCGLDYALTITSLRFLGSARLVSTPSQKISVKKISWAWLGISTLKIKRGKAFTEFGRFYSKGFPEGTQVRLTFYEVSGLSPARLPIPPQGHYPFDLKQPRP